MSAREIALALVAACAGETHVISPYGATDGRPNAHSGVDFEGIVGDPVLAAADGVVAAQIWSPDGAGRCVLVEHRPALYTLYCHLARSLVTSGQTVARGQQIAELGHTGAFAGDTPHLHLEVCTFPCAGGSRQLGRNLDPMQLDAGCFDPARTYPPSALTHPIACTGR